MKAPCCSRAFTGEQRPLQDRSGGAVTAPWRKSSDVSGFLNHNQTDVLFYGHTGVNTHRFGSSAVC